MVVWGKPTRVGIRGSSILYILLERIINQDQQNRVKLVTRRVGQRDRVECLVLRLFTVGFIRFHMSMEYVVG